MVALFVRSVIFEMVVIVIVITQFIGFQVGIDEVA